MSPPPTTGKHAVLQERLRRQVQLFSQLVHEGGGVDGETMRVDVSVPSADLITLLDYIHELEEVEYSAWEFRQGEDL
jgi:hypothetical protein